MPPTYPPSRSSRAASAGPSRILALLSLVLSLSACAGRHAALTGSSGPVAWQVTELQFVERLIDGTPRQLYTFTLVLDETQGQDLTFTQVVSVIQHPYLPTTPQQVPVQWHLRPRGTLRQPFFFPWCSTEVCKQQAALAPLRYTIALLGTDTRGRPVQVTLRTTLPPTLPSTPPATALVAPGGPIAMETVQGHILVRGLVNQHESVTLLLDTGATATSLTPEVLHKLDLHPSAETPTRTTAVVGGTRLQVPVLTLQSLSVGTVRRDNLPVGVLSSFPNAPLIDGILGADFLQSLTLTFDYARSQLWLLPPGTAPSGSLTAATAIPLQYANGLLLVPVRLNGQAPVSLILDTGASYSMVTPVLAQQLGLQPAPDAPTRTMQRGDGQQHSVAFVRCPTLQLGEAVVQNVPVGVVDILPQAPAIGGLLGMDVLTRFTVTLDRTTRQLWLTPSPAGPS